MPTFTALTTLPGRAAAEALGAAMENMEPAPTGVGVFELEDGSGLWEVGGYFTEPPDRAALALLEVAFMARPFAVSQLPETDWVAKVRRELAPVEAGRFYLFGSHDAETVPQDRVPLLIEASMAFGTGHHGTTLGCLRAFDRLLTTGWRPGPVADVGCGTAVLAMAAARVREGVTVAGDLDPVAVEVALANLAANDLADQVTCVEAAGVAHPAFEGAMPFDLIFANILKAPLLELASDLSAACAGDGFAILSGILNEQADEVVQHYAQFGFNEFERDRIGEWSTTTLRRTHP